MAHRKNYGPLYSFPMAAWFTVFFLAPIIIIVIYSFLKKGLYGGVEWEFSLEAYRNLTNPSFIVITVRTIITSIIATVITILIALPCGYFMARSRNQTLLLLLIIIPFWTNFLIRVFAWMNILGNNGFLNEFLMRIGLIDDYIHFLYNQNVVILVLVYMYLPYAILPLYSTIDKFDFSLLEAARDLGATKLASMIKVLLPNIRSGMYTAVLFTFIPIFGAYAVPLLVGGKDSYMLGNIIADQLTKSRNWPLASAISMVLTVVTTAGVLLMMNLQKKDASRIADASKSAGTARAALDTGVSS
ncbi:ABC transporter permease [Leadbettera azotonutricia]|uniref:Spermidine/putrescine transport system permease protein PotB n=1 Tax=Leadbettera azotonutricia (strain ATCC BAA-888 / DSM 13862 / ZAS-9) TaxID=545695 RepID=F5YF95_LEAAZ|nr:ABC transporter permease [Leadbettera azotonutricia]AEF81343.1 spermidine/putrescine transport system permease protein PotB [Leadbettera azotonutricia ZAS-9]